MINETEMTSHALTAGKLLGNTITSSQLTSIYVPISLDQTEKMDTGLPNYGSFGSMARPKEISVQMNCRRKSDTPSEHGLLRPFSSHISFIQRMADGLLIAGVYLTILNLHEVVLNADNLLAAILAILTFLIFAEMFNLYKSWRISPKSDEIRVLGIVWTVTVATLLMLAFMTKTTEIYSRLVVTIWFIAVPIVLGVVRLARRAILSHVRRHGANTRSVAIVGNNSIGHRLVKHFDASPWAGLVVTGFFDARRSETSSVNIDGETYSLRPLADLILQARSGEVDSVYVALPLSSERLIEEVVNQLADTTASVYVVPDSFASELLHARWVDFGGMPLLSVHETPFFGVHGWLKRFEDIVLSSLILLLISPLMLGIAIAVKMTSPGPILFRQRRYGLNGSVVEVWKFRSMTVCEDGGNIVQATKGDKRVTPLGAFLRKTSLDELPQFINVLQGSMSVIGPRPHAVTHNEQYRQLIKGYMLRHKVKPGISGWAQINGWRGETDTLDKMKKRVEYDMEYIQNWTLWLDLKIVFLTVFRGFAGNNAY
ncbi:UDP-glucose:undecaprenyl-phosphate glucose-1-phosphate transferase [mine drainage metagenome]|uniref:UDP-glucose:undecaprenyl-phosphate glucose-1-phosphate transferase n=1 Tax=mine drainage metagenome TaxID=410659 RepID=A0A1J5SIQ1_9ZZZZ